MRRWSLARQVLVVQTVVLLVVLVAAGTIAFLLERNHNVVESQDRVVAAATTIATDPVVITGVQTADPTAVLQPFAERQRLTTGTDFVVIMSTDRVRWTHTTVSRIGETYLGTVDAALAGGIVVEEYTGTLGRSVRAVAPVVADGQVIALVSVGITLERLSSIVLRSLPVLIGLFAGVLAVAALGSWWVARWVRRRTRGRSAADIEEALTAQEAVVQSMTEGLIHIDERRTIRTANAAATRMLGAADLTGDIESAGIGGTLGELLRSGRPAVDEPHVVAESLLVVNQRPVTWSGRSYGSVTTLRDLTALRRMEGELATTTALADALSAQAHEAANRLHTVVMLVETGRTTDALDYATEQLALSHRLTESIAEQVDHPVLAALLLGKASQAAERGADLLVRAEGDLAGTRQWLSDSDIVSVVGNLVDNGIEAAAAHHPAPVVRVDLDADGSGLHISVADNGPGIPAEHAADVVRRGFSTKPARDDLTRGIGLSLVQGIAERHHGRVLLGAGPDGGAELVVELRRDPA